MLPIKWKSKSNLKFDGNLKEYIGKVRGIENVDEFLNPSSDNVNSPLLLKNIKEATERVIHGIREGESILVFADPDP